MYKLKIKVTQDILKKSMMCGTENNNKIVSKNCAIALAVRDIFPEANVTRSNIYVNYDNDHIDLPFEATEFIHIFDKLNDTPEARLLLPELEFEIEIPDNIINNLNIDELLVTLKNHETLELIEQ